MTVEGQEEIKIVFLNKVGFNETQKPHLHQTADSFKESGMIQSFFIKQNLRQNNGQILTPETEKRNQKEAEVLNPLLSPLRNSVLFNSVIKIRSVVSMSVSKVHLEIGMSLQFTDSKVEERDDLQVYKTN